MRSIWQPCFGWEIVIAFVCRKLRLPNFLDLQLKQIKIMEEFVSKHEATFQVRKLSQVMLLVCQLLKPRVAKHNFMYSSTVVVN